MSHLVEVRVTREVHELVLAEVISKPQMSSPVSQFLEAVGTEPLTGVNCFTAARCHHSVTGVASLCWPASSDVACRTLKSCMAHLFLDQAKILFFLIQPDEERAAE